MISVDFYGVDFKIFGCGVDNVDASDSGDDVCYGCVICSHRMGVWDMTLQ